MTVLEEISGEQVNALSSEYGTCCAAAVGVRVLSHHSRFAGFKEEAQGDGLARLPSLS